MIVRMAHIRGVQGLRRDGGLCVPHVRAWFKRNGVDLRAFVRDGMTEEELTAIGGDNAFVQAVIAFARNQEQQGNG